MNPLGLSPVTLSCMGGYPESVAEAVQALGMSCDCSVDPRDAIQAADAMAREPAFPAEARVFGQRMAGAIRERVAGALGVARFLERRADDAHAALPEAYRW